MNEEKKVPFKWEYGEETIYYILYFSRTGITIEGK